MPASNGQQDPPQQDSTPARQRKPPRGLLPPELVDLVTPAVKFGAATGGAGATLGLVTGIVKDTSPVLFSLFAGAQCFALGSSYWVSRTAIMRAWAGPADEQRLSRGQMVTASSIAGGTAGMVGGLIRGPKNIIPGMVAFTIYGAVGQAIFHKYQDWQARPVAPRDEKSGPWFDPKGNFIKRLSEKEYVDVMQEKILRLDVEIALIDDRIAELKAKQAEEAGKTGEKSSMVGGIKDE